MKSKTILLIDDDSDFLENLKARCQSLGLETSHARNWLTATLAINMHSPDIICLDVELPTGNGLQFCRMLRKAQPTNAIPVVILTAYVNLETRNGCRDLNVHYVLKSDRYWAVLERILTQLLAPPSVARPRTRDCESLLDTAFSFYRRRFQCTHWWSGRWSSVPPSSGDRTVVDSL